MTNQPILTRLARLMHRLRLRSPATGAEKREWAAIRLLAGRAAAHANCEECLTLVCECADSGCKAAPWHKGDGVCDRPAVMHLYRVDANYPDGPVVFCGPCGDDALDSGVFAAGADLPGITNGECCGEGGCCASDREPHSDIVAP